MSTNRGNGAAGHEDVVVRKAERGWVVGDENVADLTSAMVLADLFAADQADDDSGVSGSAGSGSGPQPVPVVSGAAGETQRLAVTVAQLEHALAARVRVEQAIGVLAERHRLRPREAFDLLRKASRARGARTADLAQDVVASTANPLLRLPAELSRVLPEPRPRGRSLRRARTAASS
jgi:hypothetical protein